MSLCVEFHFSMQMILENIVFFNLSVMSESYFHKKSKQALNKIGADFLLHQHNFLLDLGLSTTAVGLVMIDGD